MSLINEGKLVLIRPVTKEDLEIFILWNRSSDALGGFNAPYIRSLEQYSKKHSESGFISNEHTIFAIERKEDNLLIGKIGYSRDNPICNTMARTFSILGDPGHRGNGYATEARMLLINYLFLSTDMERVYSETEEHNKATRRSLEKCEMKFEGVLRHVMFDLGRWNDFAIYSILRQEWKEAAKYKEIREPFEQPWFTK
ncbi:MAG TPA: GNAT family protein [Bacteriovoracaceae bacterium]|nr:GNAT family protein [Bacteriovoracaceae bacterium]